MGAYLPNRQSRGEMTLSPGVLMNFVEWHASLVSPCTSCAFRSTFTSSMFKASRRTVEPARSCHLGLLGVRAFLPAANPVPEVFSHNTKGSHPELSALDSLSSQANKSLGMLSESEGRSLQSRLRRLLTLTLPLSMSHNKRSRRTRHNTRNRPVSISDRSLENVLHLVTQTRSEAVGLKFVWVRVQIGQLSCKACVCVSGTPSVR